MEVNQQYYKYWRDIWSSQSEEVLDATALIRVVEMHEWMLYNMHLEMKMKEHYL